MELTFWPVIATITGVLVNLLSIEYAVVVRPIPSTLERLNKWEKKCQGAFITQIKEFARTGDTDDLESVEDLGIQHAVVAGFKEDLEGLHGRLRSDIFLYLFTVGEVWVGFFVYDGLTSDIQGLVLFMSGGLLFACFWNFYGYLTDFLSLKEKIIFKHI